MNIYAIGRERPARSSPALLSSETMGAEKGLNVADLLEAPGLTSTLRERLQAADANGDGIISASEMMDVMQSEMYATRDRKLMVRVLIALGVACLLIIAAVVGLTYVVVNMSKDTGVENNVLVSKDGLQPLSTASLQQTIPLADLYKATSPSALDWLTHVTVPFGEGQAILKVKSVYLVPGERVRFDTASPNVSVEVTAEGLTVSGDETASNGGRRLSQTEDSGGTDPQTATGTGYVAILAEAISDTCLTRPATYSLPDDVQTAYATCCTDEDCPNNGVMTCDKDILAAHCIPVEWGVCLPAAAESRRQVGK